jgi:hypothetical protein
MMMLPGRSDDKMLENVEFLPPQVMALRSSLFMSHSGFKGLPNIKVCTIMVNKSSKSTFHKKRSQSTERDCHIEADLQQQHALARVLQRIVLQVERGEA